MASKSGTGYPKRDPYFSHRFCRVLTKAAAANEIGCDSCWLLTVIAHQEDAKRYRGPVTYYNEQLMPLCGFRSHDRLIRARKRAIEAGWLFYKPGGKSKAGIYWCTIPPRYSDIPDTPMDEGEPVDKNSSDLRSQNESASKEGDSVQNNTEEDLRSQNGSANTQNNERGFLSKNASASRAQAERKPSASRAQPRTFLPSSLTLKTGRGNSGDFDKSRGWKGRLKSEDFCSLETGVSRFADAVATGDIEDSEFALLNFLSLWHFVGRSRNMDKPPACFIARLKERQWGDLPQMDEDAAQEFLRNRRRRDGPPEARDLSWRMSVRWSKSDTDYFREIA